MSADDMVFLQSFFCYRKNFDSHEKTIEFTIPIESLNLQVTYRAYIIATENINNFNTIDSTGLKTQFILRKGDFTFRDLMISTYKINDQTSI